MTKTTTRYFDSTRLLTLLELLPKKLKEEGISQNYLNQLKTLLELIQTQEYAIQIHNKYFSDRNYPLAVDDSQFRLIQTLV